MPDFLSYIPTIIKICSSEGNLSMVEAPVGFPFPTAYPGQMEAVKQLREVNEALLCSHTGSGKTAVFITATTDEHGNHRPSIIIEPRKFLQVQCARTRNDTVIFGRSEYPCPYEDNAATAPCRGPKESYEIDGKVVKCFVAFNEKTGKEERIPYPCPGCEYLKATSAARNAISSGDTVICNFGNFWAYLKDAEVVVIDEADLFFQSISAGRVLKYVAEFANTTKDTLVQEALLAEKDLKHLQAMKPGNKEESRVLSGKIDKAKNHLLAVKGMVEHDDLCFQYQKGNRMYVEIRPDRINELKSRIFPMAMEDGRNRKLVITTATPSSFTAQKTISYEVFMRTAIFYSPVDVLTASNVAKHPEVLRKAADFIEEIHAGFKRSFGEDGRKMLIHAGNLGTHAAAMKEYLGADRCDVHQSGQLMSVIEKFRVSDAEYLVVCAAEYGADVNYVNHQVVLKVPYATLDERLQAFQAEIGNKRFSDWYAQDALNRVVQQCGRVGRGAGGVGFTFILDRKFGELYGRYYDRLPKTFVNALKRSGTV